ncbi:MAG: hypothetical protein IT560_12590 [Alphaproteobacteria bacterium]|nr:hypothetical protein [Alphaproteobacteria bacterium]
MASRSITDTFNDAALTAAEKAAEMSFAASGNTQRMGEYSTLKNTFKKKLQALKDDAEKLLKSPLLSEVEQVAETIMADGLAAGEREDHTRSLQGFETRVAEDRGVLLDIRAEIKPLTDTFTLLQAAEKTMIGLANGMREDSRLALIALGNIDKDAQKIEDRLQDVSDAIGMVWNMLSDVRDHHRRENEKNEMRDFLDGSRLSTDKPVAAPRPARFRRVPS